MENQALTKLKSIAHFLKISNKHSFQNWNLKLFTDYITSEPEISAIINSLISKYPHIYQIAENRKPEEHINDHRAKINTFEEWVVFCLAYLICRKNKGDFVIERFIIVPHDLKNEVDKKFQFYNDCIEPILIYIELQIKHALNTIRILQRYKVFCEWYNRQELINSYKNEPEITKKHLSKFLFDQGFTFSLSETIVPSGRIDNFALNLGLKSKEELSNLPDAIVVESKILDVKDRKKDLQEVKNQIEKRINELNFSEGYCVIFNKMDKFISIKNIAGNIQGISFIKGNEKCIYFLMINLNDAFYNSGLTLDTEYFEIQ